MRAVNAGGGSYLPRQGSFMIQPADTFFGLTGPAVVKSALGEDVTPDYRALPRATYTDPEAAFVGLTLDQARSAGLDAFELALTRQALDRGLPILAVCRGAQALNVACGGTLHQHVPGHRQTAPATEPTHGVTIEPRSRTRARSPSRARPRLKRPSRRSPPRRRGNRTSRRNRRRTSRTWN